KSFAPGCHRRFGDTQPPERAGRATVSPILLLTGLLALAYFGSMLVGGRTIRGFGLPSGTEFLFLGVIFRPHFAGVFTRPTRARLDGISSVAVGWLSVFTGTHYGSGQNGKVSRRRMATGVVMASATALVTAVPAMALAFALTNLPGRDVVAFGIAVG